MSVKITMQDGTTDVIWNSNEKRDGDLLEEIYLAHYSNNHVFRVVRGGKLIAVINALHIASAIRLDDELEGGKS